MNNANPKSQDKEDIPFIYVRRDGGDTTETSISNSNQGENLMIHNSPNIIQHLDLMADETAHAKARPTQPQSSAFVPAPPVIAPGKYIARIDHVQVDTKEYDIVRMEFTILNSEYYGHQDMKWYHLKSPKSRKFFQKEFQLIGIPMLSREDLLERASAAIGKEIVVTISYADNGNKAIYVSGAHAKPAPAPSALEDIWKR